MSLRVVDGIEDAEYRADLDRLAHQMKGSTSFVVSYVKDGTRHFDFGGDVDPDAEAGFLARVLAAKAQEDYG